MAILGGASERFSPAAFKEKMVEQVEGAKHSLGEVTAAVSHLNDVAFYPYGASYLARLPFVIGGMIGFNFAARLGEGADIVLRKTPTLTTESTAIEIIGVTEKEKGLLSGEGIFTITKRGIDLRTFAPMAEKSSQATPADRLILATLLEFEQFAKVVPGKVAKWKDSPDKSPVWDGAVPVHQSDQSLVRLVFPSSNGAARQFTDIRYSQAKDLAEQGTLSEYLLKNDVNARTTFDTFATRLKLTESWYEGEAPIAILGIESAGHGGGSVQTLLEGIHDSRVPFTLFQQIRPDEKIDMRLSLHHGVFNGQTANKLMVHALSRVLQLDSVDPEATRPQIPPVETVRMLPIHPVDMSRWEQIYRHNPGLLHLIHKLNELAGSWEKGVGPIEAITEIPPSAGAMLNYLYAHKVEKQSPALGTRSKLMILASAMRSAVLVPVKPDDEKGKMGYDVRSSTDLQFTTSGALVARLYAFMQKVRHGEVQGIKNQHGERLPIDVYLALTEGAYRPDSVIGQHRLKWDVTGWSSGVRQQIVAGIRQMADTLMSESPEHPGHLQKIEQLQSLLPLVRTGMEKVFPMKESSVSHFFARQLALLTKGIKDGQAGHGPISVMAKWTNRRRIAAEAVGKLTIATNILSTTGDKNFSDMGDRDIAPRKPEDDTVEAQLERAVCRLTEGGGFTSANNISTNATTGVNGSHGRVEYSTVFDLDDPVGFITQSMRYFVRNPEAIDHLLAYVARHEQSKRPFPPATQRAIAYMREVQTLSDKFGRDSTEIMRKLQMKWNFFDMQSSTLTQYLIQKAMYSPKDHAAAKATANAFLDLFVAYIDRGHIVRNDRSAPSEYMEFGPWLLKTLPTHKKLKQIEEMQNYLETIWHILPPKGLDDPVYHQLKQNLYDDILKTDQDVAVLAASLNSVRVDGRDRDIDRGQWVQDKPYDTQYFLQQGE